MNAFEYYLSTRIVFGQGKSDQVSEYVKQYGTKVLLTADKTILSLKLAEPIICALENEGILYVIYDGIEPNPRLKNVDEGSLLCRKEQCDVILAIGGGSTIDVAKGISVCAVNDGPVYEYLGGRGENVRKIDRTLPVIAIPTTSGTGSEVSMYAVIMDDEGVKDNIASDRIYPKVAVIDPNLMMRLPKSVTVSTGLDVFGHALEAYTSTVENALCDVFALDSMKRLMKWLPVAVNEGTAESRAQMAFASTLAGSAMSHCAATLPHAIGCALGGNLGIPHGVTVGILQIPMILFNRQACAEQFREVVNYIDPSRNVTNETAADVLVEMLEELFESIGFQTKLGKDVPEDVIRKMVDDSSIHGCISCNRREIGKDEIRKMIESIL